MLIPPYFGSGDRAHSVLVPHLAGTERLLQRAVRRVDPDGDAQIVLSCDLSFPHDVMRLCGGFATGIYVEWRACEPFVPVDIAMNIDVSSVFVLNESWSSVLNESSFERLRAVFDRSSYEFNFHKGNHFISSGRLASGDPVLVVHSNEKEFKYQANGLCPVPGNWFFERVEEMWDDGRRIRYIRGEPAARFIDLARSLDEYSIERHRFVASILGEFAGWKDELHKVHYYMPTEESACLGTFLCQPGDVVPIFSAPGAPIDLFEVGSGGGNPVRSLRGGEPGVLVPHGWGKTAAADAEIAIRTDGCMVNQRWYPALPETSMGREEGLVRRVFATDPEAMDSYAASIRSLCPGSVIDQIIQEVSLSRSGCLRHGVTGTS